MSTYGLLRAEGTAFLNELMHALHDGGLLVTQRGEFPLVTLTDKGERVMRGGGRYRLVWPARRRESMVKDGPASLTAADLEELAPFDGMLYERLKDVRKRLAERDGVPLYAVFSNKTLEAFVRLRPQSLEAGMRIKGVGPAKAEKYLGDFLVVLRGG